MTTDAAQRRPQPGCARRAPRLARRRRAAPLGGAARPWLRREHWTRENLLALCEAARRGPVASSRLLGGAAALLLLLAWSLGGRGERRRLGRGARGAVPRLDRRGGHAAGAALGDLRLEHPEQPGQDRRARPGGPDGEEGRPADPLRRRPVRGGDPPQPGAARAGAGRPSPRRARTSSCRTSRTSEELLAARLRVEKNDLELKDVQEGKGRVKEEEAAQPVTNAERELQKAQSQLADLKPLLAEGFITRTELERAEQQVARAPGGRSTSRSAAATRSSTTAGPLELSQARSDAQVEPRDAAPARERRLLPHRPEAGRHRLRPEPDRGGRRQARARAAAARALRGARGGPGHRRLQGRLLRLRAEEAPGGRPGLGEPAADHPARHLAHGGGDAGARDRHPQGRAQPEGHGARRGLSRPAPHRRGHAGRDARPGGARTARDEVLLGRPCR